MTLPFPLLTLAIYVVLAGAYLVVVPAAILVYMQKRFYTSGSVERLLMYFTVFLFFPGLLILGLLTNARPKKRELEA
ncbi:NAD(P)H-quinone oxidoreductase subunit L [Leptolyngbya sp. AN02str]|uniref:NAD(P)H-quinone oxidoreductase subunit L n=1 Tax=Leptolyngbya sp. AN02str TaxID=3423363 RepID=UPI003D323655